MRRNLMLVVGLASLVGGCGMFSAHSNVVESAAGQDFTADRLANIMTSVKGPVAYDARTAQFITTIWTDMTLFSQAVAQKKLTSDSALVADAMWPTIMQATAARWMDTITARRSKVTQAMIDSAIKADSLRGVQHILVAVDSAAPKEDHDRARKKAEHFLAEIKGGASFSKIAFDSTDDPGSKPDSGWYGLSPKAKWDKPFGEALWKLKPGEVSGIVTGHYGYHIIRRPNDSESAKLWRDELNRAASQDVEKAYIAELSANANVKVDAGAVAHVRQSLDDLSEHEKDNTALATYKDGSFTIADFVKWMRAISADPQEGPQRLEGFKSAKDSDIVKTVQQMTDYSLLTNEAKKNHIALTADEWKQMQAAFSEAMDSMKVILGLTDAVLDPKASIGAREAAAGKRVDAYFTELVQQKAPPLKPLPGILSATLRSRMPNKFYPAAMQHALDMAKTKHAADSVAADAAGARQPPAVPPGAIQPAPSGPPVGNPPPPPAPKKP